MNKVGKADKGMGRFTWSRVTGNPESLLPHPTLIQREKCKIGLHDWFYNHEGYTDLCLCCDAIRENLTHLYDDEEGDEEEDDE